MPVGKRHGARERGMVGNNKEAINIQRLKRERE